MGILDTLESKPAFFKEFWEIPPLPEEPDCHNHRLIYRLPANARLERGESRIRAGFGAALESDKAVEGCLGEAMERYSGYRRDLRKVRICSWKELGKQALHPNQIAGFSSSQFREKSFPYAPFTEKTKVGWVKGFSLIRKVPVWVPTQLVFLSTYLKKEVPFIPRVSTGLACGSSWESAVLHGLLEVVERDSFSILWLNKLSMPIVDLETEVSHPVKNLFEKSFARPHLEYIVIDMTSDLGIPSFCGIARQKDGKWPLFVVGCACRLNAASAIESALVDAATGRSICLYRRKEFEAFTRGKSELQVFKKMDVVHDHAKVYADPRFSHYAEFMWASEKRIPLDKLRNFSRDDAKKDLKTCLSILKVKGHDVVAVDITPKEVAEYELSVVKVIVPGLQPLHFGWKSEYLRNRRLYEVPHTLGYTNRPATEKEIYRIPHPMM